MNRDNDEVLIRDASVEDAAAVAGIGSRALAVQYRGVVDPVAVEAAIEQTYSEPAVADCIARCAASDDAAFLVAERDGAVRAFLHYDAFGEEPELHRLYVDETERGAGIGGRLVEELHSRLGPSTGYMLLVVEGNEGAVRFYERHGSRVAESVDGLPYYGDHMGVDFPEETAPFRLLLMRRRTEPVAD